MQSLPFGMKSLTLMQKKCKDLKQERLYMWHFQHPSTAVHADRRTRVQWERVLRTLRASKSIADWAVRPKSTWQPTENEPMPPWHVIAKSKLWSDEDHAALVHTLKSPTLKPQVFA